MPSEKTGAATGTNIQALSDGLMPVIIRYAPRSGLLALQTQGLTFH